MITTRKMPLPKENQMRKVKILLTPEVKRVLVAMKKKMMTNLASRIGLRTLETRFLGCRPAVLLKLNSDKFMKNRSKETMLTQPT